MRKPAHKQEPVEDPVEERVEMVGPLVTYTPPELRSVECTKMQTLPCTAASVGGMAPWVPLTMEAMGASPPPWILGGSVPNPRTGIPIGTLAMVLASACRL